MSGHHHRSDRYYSHRATPTLEQQQSTAHAHHHQPSYTTVQASSSYQSGYQPSGQRGYSNAYNQWPANDAQMSSTAYSNLYDYPYQPERVSSPYATTAATNERRLPPLDVSGGDRWSSMYGGGSSTSGLETSMRSNPSSYASANYGGSYNSHHGSTAGSSSGYQYGHGLPDATASYPAPTPPVPRASSAAVRSHTSATQHAAPMSYSPPPPVSPTSEADQNAPIKKKRKRADANQLRVLNDVYARTAFPSTEERHQLAKQLDMSPRSVQIWFQNKRQAMRSTHRQGHTAVSSGASGPPSSMPDSMQNQSPAGGVIRTTSTRRGGRTGY